MTFILKDAKGNPLTNKRVTITVNVNDRTWKAITDNNGRGVLGINTAKPGIYYFTVHYAGDAIYTASSKSIKVNIVKKNTKLTAPTKTYKKTTKTKKLTTTLKDMTTGKVVKNKYVTFKINGKSYKVKTNSKGVATVKVKLTVKKTYKYTVKFNGNTYYKATSKTGKVIIK